jgi:hypothetical protein
MSIRRTLLAAASTLALTGGLVTAGAVSADAATPKCGPNCVQIFSAKFGTPTNPAFVETVFRGVARAGVPTGLSRVSGTDPAGDLIVSRGGPVSSFYADHMVSKEVNEHYGTLTAVQIEYAPKGHRTGLCASLARAAYQNEPLSLQSCRAPGRSVFIIDTADSPATAPTYFPIVNASTRDFHHPFAMTIVGNPRHRHFVPIIVRHLRHNPACVPSRQLWGSVVFNP